MAENFKRPFWVVQRLIRDKKNLEYLSGEGRGHSFVILFTSKEAAKQARQESGESGKIIKLPSVPELEQFLRSCLAVTINEIAIDEGSDNVQIYPTSFILDSLKA